MVYPQPQNEPHERHVLFVDDDPTVRRSVGRFLSRQNVPFVLASDGDEALAAVDAQPTRYSVVLADYCMPDTDGVTVLKEVAVTAPWATRILVSGHLNLDDALAAVNSGAIFQIVTKPMAPETLLALIRRAQDRADLAQRNAHLLSELRRKNAALLASNQRFERLASERTQALLEVMASAIDMRTTRTLGRSRRLAAYARRLARQLGLEPPDLDSAEYGALLAGFESLSAPDLLLRPVVPLSCEQHSRLGQFRVRAADLLNQVEFLRGAAAVIRLQGERYDGTGGPFGLRGQDIPVGARILSVVQVLDNLTCSEDGPTRGWSWAREEVRRQAGAALDPEVVDAFAEIEDSEWATIQAVSMEGELLHDESIARL